MSGDYLKVIQGLDLDVRILARELNKAPGSPGDTVRVIDRMLADLRSLREAVGQPERGSRNGRAD